MVKQFGNTWWGQCWLDSLQGIDFDNRIPRGAAYARQGAVRSVKFKDNVITAKVKGSRSTPYSVTIVIPPFFEEDIEKLMNEIIRRPAVIAGLLNKKLNPELLSICEGLGLKLFPRRWSDFKMACSCPDWAVPCKHLAAVIYMMAQEIDTDPFLIFEMHNVHLLTELEKRNIRLDRDEGINVPVLKQLLKPSKKTEAAVASHPGKIDFSTLEDIGTSLYSFLEENPPFYDQGDFKSIYISETQRAQKALVKAFKKHLSADGTFNAEKPAVFSRRSKVAIRLDTSYQWRIESTEGELSVAQFAAALFAINLDYLSDYDDSIAAGVQILHFAMHLLEHGAVVPQIMFVTEKNYVIRWLPALIDERVRCLRERLDKALDMSFVQIEKKKPEPVDGGVEWLSSLFLDFLMHEYASASVSRLPLFFFKGTREKFSGVGQKGISGSIKSWLDRFYMSSGEFRAVLAIDETEADEFSLNVYVEKNPSLDRTVNDIPSLKKSVQDIPSPASPLGGNPASGRFSAAVADVKFGTEDFSEPVPVRRVITDSAFDGCRFEILREISLLSHFVTGLDRYINSSCESQLTYKLSEFGSFLSEVIPVIRLLNVRVILPKSLQELIRPKAAVRLKKKSDVSKAFIRIDDMLAFDWQVALGDELVSLEEYYRILAHTDGLIKFKGRYIYACGEDLATISKQISKNRTLSSFELLQAALTEEYEGAPVALSHEVRSMVDAFRDNSTVALPSGLNAQLRPYQSSGYSWLYRNMKIGFGSIIADDMGLGKTLQVICLLLKLKEEGLITSSHRAMVVVPKGLLINWQMEVSRFAPSLSTFIYHGVNRQLSDFQADILLTTYGTLRSDVEMLKKKKWCIMVIDEAQNIKNQDTSQAKSVKEIKAQTYIAMSGTPVENRLSEFWSIMDFANKGYLGTSKNFREKYSVPIQMYNNQDTLRHFKLATSPFLLRRLKTDKSIISDLPDKIVQNEYCTLTKYQTAMYDSTLAEAMKAIEGIESTDSQSLFKRQGLILQMILALKQICNHPSQFLKDGKSDSSLSGKTQLLLDMVQSIVDSDEKVLIFTQFKEMGMLLQDVLEQQLGEKPMFYHGGTSTKERQAMIERFQKGKADKVFILSLKAAGTGLNLTAASHVIHYDLWWNPAVENQATDRAYRIGQDKNVFVHRFITKDTFEEKIDEMINTKKQLAEMTVPTGENWLGKLSNKELHEIFG